MAWRRIGGKPLSEPMLTRFTDTCMQHERDELNENAIILMTFSSLAQLEAVILTNSGAAIDEIA